MATELREQQRVTSDNGGGETSPVDRLGAAENEQQHYRDLQIEAPQPALRVRLDEPVEYDGQQYSELILDFDAMIGKDFLRAEREFTRQYKAEKNEIAMPEMKHLYHNIIAAHLAKVPLGLIWKLPRRYYVPLRTEVLKACGSAPDEEKA